MSDLFILKIIRICECGFKKYLCQGGFMSRGRLHPFTREGKGSRGGTCGNREREGERAGMSSSLFISQATCTWR